MKRETAGEGEFLGDGCGREGAHQAKRSAVAVYFPMSS